MAEEVPVSEVLFNATEYLCKLGSNLRSRSQNLKEKRISKEKLKNTHAVRKAASKLLLMCQLSKKSLENVENGVKKVLTIVDASLCGPSVAAKNKTVPKRGESKKDCFYFEYDSFKLRISKEITLKHYTSVKVHAKRMPASMLDKYPVYCKCKLYQRRKKALRKNEEKVDAKLVEGPQSTQTNNENTNGNTDNEKLEKSENQNENKAKSDEKEDQSSSVKKTSEIVDILNSGEKTRPIIENNSDDNKSSTNPHSDSTKKSKSVVEGEETFGQNSDRLEDSEMCLSNTEVEKNDRILKSPKQSDKPASPIIIENNSDDNKSSTKPHSDSTKKSKSVVEGGETSGQNSDRLEDSEMCLSNTEVEKNDHILKSPKQSDKPASPILTKKLEHPGSTQKLEMMESQTNVLSREKGRSSLDSNETDKNNSKTEKISEEKEKHKSEKSRKSNKSKSVKFMDDSSNSSHASGVVEDNGKPQKKCDENEHKKDEEPEVINLSDDSPEKAKNADGEIESKGEKTSQKKPFLKLVSLNKLLKPDVLQNVAKKMVNKNSVIKTYGNKKARIDTDWLEKKKKVLEFKPKNFNIVVIRMPDKFSDEYLCKYSLKKIIKNGTVIHKLSSDLPESITENLKENTKKNGTQNTVSIELSDESDENNSTTDGNKNKKMSEKNNATNKEDAQQTRKRDKTKNNKTSDLNKKESDKKLSEEGNQSKCVSKDDSVKPAEPPKTPEGKNEKKDKTTPRSKRKLIMESMRAKRMLLTHSSSSETDDDQLRSALNDIKKSLLHGSSTEEEIDLKKIVQSNQRRLSTSSDSDDSVKILKKKKKNPFEEKDQDESSISQVDGTHDDQSNSSSSQMGRSKTKVASSSNQSSETVDSNDIEINRLTNPITLNRSRRRGSADKPATRSQRMPKAPPIREEMLEPESSGSAVSEAGSDAGDVEELPPIAVPELNGDGINHLAKEDLLAHSDSSSSNEKEGSEDKKEDSEDDDDEKLKSRRRKPNAIDSDSEAGLSRPKADKVSDFEDSESESEPRKKTKRKKKETDSDGSTSSNDGSKKKRRRIKQVKESDGSGSDTENEGKNKHGRKNIRKVMSKNQLEEATKKAARQEKERVARIAERQKQYNNLEFDESGKPDEVVLDKVVLDFDPETKQPLIEVDRGLVKKLKPHQANGIKFMWNACFESVKRIKKDRGSGCILAHCMGLGKTLQVVSLTHTLLVHKELTNVKRVLVVCPLSTVLNWVNEFSMWLKHAESDLEVDVFELSRHKQNSERAWQLQQWVECGGVCVLGYEMFRNLSADNTKKFKKKMLKTFQEALVDPGPDLVVCDEGHLLKNEKTSLSQSMNRVRTLRRIVLTGTPLQNNLKEYYCMVQFVKPNLLGKYNEYLNRFVNPITNGQYTDSTEKDISIMKRRSHVLHTMLDGAVQRRDYGVLAPFLPPKHEFVLFITLTEIQTKLYKHYLENYSRRPLPGKSSGFLFPDFQSLQRIWTHPLVLKYNSERYEIMQQKKRDKEEEDSEGSLVDFIDDDSTPEESSTEESSDDLSDVSDDSRKKKKKKSAKKGKSNATGRRGTRANPVEQLEEERPNPEVEEVKLENPTEWWMKLVTDDELEDIRHSHKLLLLFDILRQCEAIGDKLLVFSQSLYSLDLIEHFLGKVDEATQEGRIDEKLAGHVGSWSPGVDYFRLDGSTSCENRSIWCKNFNREDNPRARLFLISTRAGGLGINLVAANRVVIFDVSWNPSHDVQSIFRVYRFGQKKPCYIYRFLAMGTMEEKIYERQVTKQAISKRVIDEQQIDRHYAANDLAELYRFEPEPATPRPVPSLPKDRLFAEMLKEHETAIYRFHEHDSLLENKEEETLSEEERKRAWEEFENEKKAPPPAPFPNSWAFSNGMAASLLQQQQQQLAYAALAAMIRKDMPNVSDNQIRDMLPIICNANPGMFGGYDYGLMQKMSEIYKYAQPSMMNPSMMNPVMNPAGGMSTSSLQYEPPWQRQQQQQQQMRLQQLMQQQSMGAKYYAGGLGSRDPVAMALQQQRAREFLLGGGGGGGGGGVGVGGGVGGAAPGRPRGRPPLQPRAPPADVVNLADSD